MTTPSSSNPSQDERIMAALAHVSALLPMMGLIAPIVIWVTQKDKSRFVAFQALQALAYQLSMILAWFIGMGCYFCSFIGLFMTLGIASSSDASSSSFPLGAAFAFFPFMVIGLFFLGMFIFIAYGLIAAILVFQGKPFRYVLIGRWIERYLQQNPDPVVNRSLET